MHRSAKGSRAGRMTGELAGRLAGSWVFLVASKSLEAERRAPTHPYTILSVFGVILEFYSNLSCSFYVAKKTRKAVLVLRYLRNSYVLYLYIN